ncbi:MBL fold metallo-hydrolase RNA specificity domain-containing protein [Bdellovibrio bacteriovorus]|uniref:MBL fold metallo-hydrolase RNA specificity domain-containing protein n=1 Tax=Bdellovibrio TaxID=958 RepID=UPI0035A88BCB
MKISFLGGVGTVTGSKFLVSNDSEQLLVDCGLFQGLKQLRLQNWDEFPVNPKKIKAVLLTHAHLDHCGYLPLLVKQGFQGPIYCTAPTQELAKIILMDSAEIQMEDAVYANRKGFSKHHPAVPLYDIDDVQRTLAFFKSVKMNQIINTESFHFEFKSSGHILGATSVYLSDATTTVLFSGDLGRYHDPLMFPPDNPKSCDHVVMESTYGDRQHDKLSSMEQLGHLINKAWKAKSVLLIPAFAVGRSQNLIYEIIQLKRRAQIPSDMPIYFNSPMGSEVSDLYKKYHDFQKLDPGEFENYTSQIRFVRTADESRALNERKGPMVIIASSGMLTGGRILHHLKAFAGDPRNIILLAGFQAMGTRGWTLASGQNKVKVHGSYIDIFAEVVTSDSFSAHADQTELLRWLSGIPAKPRSVFLVHGEPSASDELRKKIEDKLGMKVIIPNPVTPYDLRK